MDHRLAYNTTDSPVIISKDGRTLGGGEFGAIDADDKAARPEIDAGRLAIVDETGDADSRSEQANAAVAELEQLRAAEQQSADEKQPTTRRGGSRADNPKE